MAVIERGRPARTRYRVIERFRAHTHCEVELETGRTHQIRVHMAHIRSPLVGDPVYGGRPRLPRQPSEELRSVLQGFRRQALHATKLQFAHPETGAELDLRERARSGSAELLAHCARTPPARPHDARVRTGLAGAAERARLGHGACRRHEPRAVFDAQSRGHVGDEVAAVAANRGAAPRNAWAAERAEWLTQVHGRRVLDLDAGERAGRPTAPSPAAPASFAPC